MSAADATFSEFTALRRRQKGADAASAGDAAAGAAKATGAGAGAAAQAPTVDRKMSNTSSGDADTVNLFLTEWFRLLCIALVVHDIMTSVWGTYVETRPKQLQEIHFVVVAQSVFELTSLLSLVVSLSEALVRVALAYKYGLSPWRIADTAIVVTMTYFGFWRGFKGEPPPSSRRACAS